MATTGTNDGSSEHLLAFETEEEDPPWTDSSGDETQSESENQSWTSPSEEDDEEDAEEDEKEEQRVEEGFSETILKSAIEEFAPESSEILGSLQHENDNIEGEGRRGASSGRGRTRGRGRGRGRALALMRRVRSASPEMHVRRHRGEGSRGGRRGRRGPRGHAEPSHEFKTLQNHASNAFLSQNYHDALRYAQQAIQVNPEIYAAHGILSAAYAAMGEDEKSFGALWNGAHTKRDAGLWWQIIDKLAVMRTHNNKPHLERLSYCYRQVLSLEPSNYDARRGQLAIAVALGHSWKAVRQCENILKLRPYENDVIEELAKQYVACGRPDKSIEIYQNAIKHHTQTGNIGDNSFTFNDLNVYLGIYEETRQYPRAIHELRTVSRWLLGRREERFWDEFEHDDREWDIEDEPRRIAVHEYLPDKYDLDTYGLGLPLELRVKLGIFRLKAQPDYVPEAMSHFAHLDPEDDSPSARIFDYSDLFRDVGDALKDRGFNEDALTFYEPLLRLAEEPDFSLNTALADCYHALGRQREAEACLRSAMSAAGDKRIVDVGKQLTDTSGQIEAGIKLVRIYEAQGLSRQALDQANKVLRLSRSEQVPAGVSQLSPSAEGTQTPEVTLFSVQRPRKPKAKEPKKSKKVTKAVEATLRQRKHRVTGKARSDFEIRPQTRADIAILYAKLLSSRDGMRAGNEDAKTKWTQAAEGLIAAFRAEGLFHPVERYIRFWGYSKEARQKGLNVRGDDALAEIEAIRAHEAQGREQDSIPDEYRGIKFTDWLDIFCEYALVMAKEDNLTRCYDILNAATDANVFYHYESPMLHIQVTWIACALVLADEERLLYLARDFIKRYPATPSTFSLYAVLARLHKGTLTWYHSGPNQKFVLRHIKAIDYALLSDEQRSQYDFTATEISNYHKESKDGNPHRLKELDPTLLILYGNILAHSGSYPQALNYYFRAYAVNPDNAMLCLCIAVAYIQYAMKRQTENRQYQIAQGLAFIERYHDIRTSDGVLDHVQEAEFNRARAWHSLGLTHLAVQGYEKVLEVTEAMQQDSFCERDVGYESDAAYCLQQLYSLGGDFERAREITERWMVL